MTEEIPPVDVVEPVIVEPSNGRKGVYVEPVPKDRLLFEWLEKLFYTEPENAHFPELIDCRLVSGKHNEKYGPYLKKVQFAPINVAEEALKKMPGKTRKPNREQLCSLSNELVFLMQKDCDESRRALTYGVHAWHFTTESEPYTRYVKHMKPQGRYSKENGTSEDDDALPMSQRFEGQILGHHERMFNLVGGAFEGMMDRFDRLLDKAHERIEKQDAVIQKQNEMMERALSLQAERDEKMEWTKLKVKSVEKGLEFASSMGPPLLNSLVGKQVIPTNETPETITLKNFFRTVEEGGLLTKDQVSLAFGEWDESPEHNLLKTGVLSLEQGQILFGVAHGKIPVDALDKVLPGGQFGLSQEQAMALQKIFTIEQLAPIMLIFESRRNKNAKNGA